MKLCIPVNAPKGLESLLQSHLPSAEHLPFSDTETRLREDIALRGHQAGSADDIEIHAVLCGSINRVTLRTLIEQGIKVYGTDAQTVAQAIALYDNGELEAAVVAAGCGASNAQEGGSCCGGGHGHGDGAGEQGEHQCAGEGGGCGDHGHENAGCGGGHTSRCEAAAGH